MNPSCYGSTGNPVGSTDAPARRLSVTFFSAVITPLRRTKRQSDGGVQHVGKLGSKLISAHNLPPIPINQEDE